MRLCRYRNHPEQAYGFEYIECYVWQHNSSTKACPAISLIRGGGIGSGGAEDGSGGRMNKVEGGVDISEHESMAKMEHSPPEEAEMEEFAKV